MIPNPWVIVAALVALIAVGFGGAQVGMRLERSASLKKSNAELVSANAEIQRLNNAARAAEHQHAAEVAAIGEKYETDAAIRDAEYQRDLDALRSGALKLRDPGAQRACPSSPGGPAPAPGRSDDPEGGELSEPAEEFLLAEAKRADDITRQLGSCQAVVLSDRNP